MPDMKEMTAEDVKYIIGQIRQDTISYSNRILIEEILKAELEYLEWLENFKPKGA